MTSSTPCPIKLMDKTYTIKCPDQEAERLQLAAEKLNEHMVLNKQKFNNLDEFQNLLLAALHVSHELVSCQMQQAHQLDKVTQFIHSLEHKINNTVNGDPASDPQTD